MQQGGEWGVLQEAAGDRQREHRGERGGDTIHRPTQFEGKLFGESKVRGKPDCPSVPAIGQALHYGDVAMGRSLEK